MNQSGKFQGKDRSGQNRDSRGVQTKPNLEIVLSLVLIRSYVENDEVWYKYEPHRTTGKGPAGRLKVRSSKRPE